MDPSDGRSTLSQSSVPAAVSNPQFRHFVRWTVVSDMRMHASHGTIAIVHGSGGVDDAVLAAARPVRRTVDAGRGIVTAE